FRLSSSDLTQILGQPAVLWQLQHPLHGLLNCLAGQAPKGGVTVRVVHAGIDRCAARFSEPAQALAWAVEIENDFLDRGWRSVEMSASRRTSFRTLTKGEH